MLIRGPCRTPESVQKWRTSRYSSAGAADRFNWKALRKIRHWNSKVKRCKVFGRDAAKCVSMNQKKAIRQEELNRTQRTFGRYDCFVSWTYDNFNA